MRKLIMGLLPPASCLSCRDIVAYPQMMCDDCHRELPWQNHDEPPILLFPELNISLSLFHYQPPIDYWISQLKFQNKLIYAQFFSQCFISRLQHHKTPLPDLLLPVPLHRKRLQERGFNQALEIAKPIATYFKIPLVKNGVERRKHTRAQSDLSAMERIANVDGAFVINNRLQGKHIAIIDDVVTTGNTMHALTQLLKNNNVGKIEVWCVARTQY